LLDGQQDLTCDRYNPCNKPHGSERSIDSHNPAHRRLKFHSNNPNNRYLVACDQKRKRQQAFGNRYALTQAVTIAGFFGSHFAAALPVLLILLSAVDVIRDLGVFHRDGARTPKSECRFVLNHPTAAAS